MLYAATNKNLDAHALAPTMRWLVTAALDGSTMTYGEVKRKLEKEAGFSSVFSTRIGHVAGALMNKIRKVRPDAPLINVLVVSQKDRQPSDGAGSFMADRFNNRILAEDTAKDRYPKEWADAFNAAAGEVYKVTKDQWSDLFQSVFNQTLDADTIETDRERRKQGTEEDGVSTGRNYGSGGEGPFHRALRLWVADNPSAIHGDFGVAATETEVDLDSGDRVDVVYKCIDCTIVIEVKSRISNDVDLRRGVFQCIKYRAVRKAMDVRSETRVEAYLVTESPPPGEITALLRHHGIRHFQAPWDRG
jgi:hypothetical protein